MKLKFVVSILLTFVLLGTVFAGVKQVSDDTIYDNVRRRLASDPVVKGGGIKVDVKQGVVTLSGSVELEKQKIKAEKLAKKVSGVKSVNNELLVARKTK